MIIENNVSEKYKPENKNKTYSMFGILYSGYLTDKSLYRSSINISVLEQMYLPFAFGYSRRWMCALATSSTCTKGAFSRILYVSVSPKKFLKFVTLYKTQKADY